VSRGMAANRSSSPFDFVLEITFAMCSLFSDQAEFVAEALLALGIIEENEEGPIAMELRDSRNTTINLDSWGTMSPEKSEKGGSLSDDLASVPLRPRGAYWNRERMLRMATAKKSAYHAGRYAGRELGSYGFPGSSSSNDGCVTPVWHHPHCSCLVGGGPSEQRRMRAWSEVLREKEQLDTKKLRL
jgi:hypothetical protein